VTKPYGDDCNDDLTTCAYCGQSEGHSPRCSVARHGAAEWRTTDVTPLPACATCGAAEGVPCISRGQVVASVCPGRGARPSDAPCVFCKGTGEYENEFLDIAICPKGCALRPNASPIAWGEDQDPDFVEDDDREPGGKIDYAPRTNEAKPTLLDAAKALIACADGRLAFGGDLAVKLDELREAIAENAVRVDKVQVAPAAAHCDLHHLYYNPSCDECRSLREQRGEVESRIAQTVRIQTRERCAQELYDLARWCREHGFAARGSHTESAARRLQGVDDEGKVVAENEARTDYPQITVERLRSVVEERGGFSLTRPEAEAIIADLCTANPTSKETP